MSLGYSFMAISCGSGIRCGVWKTWRSSINWRRRSDSCSTSDAAPSSAQRGSGRRKWLAKIVWLTSCGITLSRMRSAVPWTRMFQLKTWPAAKVNVVAPPAPTCPTWVIVTWQGRYQRGNS